MVEVKGLAELSRFLQALPDKLETRIATGAMRAAAKVVQQEAIRLAPVDSGELRKTIRVSVRRRRGKVTSKVVATGDENNLPVWIEYGTHGHLISVREDARPSRMTRRGLKKYSVRTLNRMVARGSLRIGTHFVGASVTHPGAKPKPFMRPALDTKAQDAVVAAAMYMRRRLTKEGLEGAADVEIEPQ